MRPPTPGMVGALSGATGGMALSRPSVMLRSVPLFLVSRLSTSLMLRLVVSTSARTVSALGTFAVAGLR